MEAKAVARVAREEASQVVTQYKASMEFENEVNEVVCDAFYKGSKKCKRKVIQAFHLSDLRVIIIDEPEEVEGGVDVAT